MLSLTFLYFATATLGAFNPALIHREVSLALAPHSQVPRGLAHAQGSLVKRAPNTSALATIISLAPNSPKCSTPCSQFTKDLSECAKLSSQSLIASCACSTTTLGDSRSCASCISLDSNTSSTNATAVVNAYNSFVDLCAADGLAAVTGTVVAGATTATAARTAAATPTANAGRTYSLSSLSFTGVASAASLVPSAASSVASARLGAATVVPSNSAAGLQVGALAGLFAMAVVLV